jgi:hypothetical protein
MATQRAPKVKKHLTLSAGLVEEAERQAQLANVNVSDVIEAWCRDRGQANGQAAALLQASLEQLVADVADLRAKVLPLVNTVTQMLRQMEGELPISSEEEATTPTTPIATYEEMYGPITTAEPTLPPEQRVEPAPRKRWRWRS